MTNEKRMFTDAERLFADGLDALGEPCTIEWIVSAEGVMADAIAHGPLRLGVRLDTAICAVNLVSVGAHESRLITDNMELDDVERLGKLLLRIVEWMGPKDDDTEPRQQRRGENGEQGQ